MVGTSPRSKGTSAILTLRVSWSSRRARRVSVLALGRMSLGLVAARRGDVARALELLADAPTLCRRLPDTYLWIEAYGLYALCARPRAGGRGDRTVDRRARGDRGRPRHARAPRAGHDLPRPARGARRAGRGPFAGGADRQPRARRPARIGRGRPGGSLTTGECGPRGRAGSRPGGDGRRGGGRPRAGARA